MNSGEKNDALHLTDMIEKLKEKQYVSLFVITINSQLHRFDDSTKKIIQHFEDNFKAKFWDHTAIVFTNWGSSPYEVKIRES